MDTRTVTLAEFLLARISEDQAVAWRAVNTDPGPAAWWAVRINADCEAKRRVVELHGSAHICWTTDYEWDDPDEHAAGGTHGACLTLRILALPYADHPDYRTEWRS